MSNVHHAALSERTEIGRGIFALRFTVEEGPEQGPLQFRCGQFISMRVGTDAAGDPILRSYSIASRPSEPLLLIVKIIPGGSASEFLMKLAIGERVRFTGPMGFFVLDLQHAGDVVLGATGTGIAPLLPMLQEMLERNERGRVTLLWGSRFVDELFWLDEIAALAKQHSRFSYRLFVSQPDQPSVAERGRITAPLLEMVKTLVQPTFYLVGNGAMIKEIKAGLVALQIDRRKQIRNEAFFG